MLPISSIITRDVKTCVKETSVLQAVNIMAQNNIGSIVVVDGKKPSGIFTERDLLIRVVARQLSVDKTSLSEVMTHDIVIAEEHDSCSTIYMKMKSRAIRHIPVVSNGELTGIVSLKDVLSLMNDMVLKQLYLPDSSGIY